MRIFKLCEYFSISKLHCCDYCFLGCDFMRFGTFPWIYMMLHSRNYNSDTHHHKASNSIHFWALEQNCLFLQKKLPYFIMEGGCGTQNPSYSQIIVRMKPVQHECFPLCKWIMQSYLHMFMFSECLVHKMNTVWWFPPILIKKFYVRGILNVRKLEFWPFWSTTTYLSWWSIA